LVGIKPIDDDTIEVYVDYWHFDETEIASWTTPWTSMPWELIASMEQAVIDGKVSFSRSGAVSKNVNWLSLIIPNDAEIIKQYLIDFKQSHYVPTSLQELQYDWQYFDERYDASIAWIEQNGHAVISNGPFYLDNYSPEARTITINSFDSPGYPFEAGKWKKFEQIKFPKITGVEISDVVNLKESTTIIVETTDSSEIHYFVSNPRGETVSSGIVSTTDGLTEIVITQDEASKLDSGANTLKIFASSDQILRPDIYNTSFLVSENETSLPDVPILEVGQKSEQSSHTGIILAIIGVVIVGIIVGIRRKRKMKLSS
jgi:peptide/nickel transport system substrate-binding protein